MRGVLAFVFVLLAGAAYAENAPRARDIGVPFSGTPGPLNAITDVAGVTVGHETIMRDLRGGHAVRTGVTAILPRGDKTLDRAVFGGFFALNGNGEMTGTHWIEESGFLEGPVMITNTHSIGAVHEGAIKWRVAQAGPDSTGYWWSLPVVAETWDGHLNDINGFHVTDKHAARAIEKAKAGPVAEGNVGGGTGMICHEFKCGIGTSSRIVTMRGGEYTVGVLVQANYGARSELRIAGAPVGKHLTENLAYDEPQGDTGSIIIVVATDAPLLPQQLKRVAKRASLGLGRMGSYAGNGSGDIFIAFSTAEMTDQGGGLWGVSKLDNDILDPVFLATADATEEAIVNAMVAARDMTGDLGHRAVAIDHEELRAVLKQYGRLAE
ncbi:P1 family peptidase [Hyphococcus sp.]|uniref:DmpA family aminopeptidase n=1 Tax=Hyphococcus sp. TaxID=2038636 RepID=UPI002086B4EC|nr:MAG: aminopeptidase [Marinicaulis sp.]